MDNIVIFSNSWTDHMQLLSAVLSRLREIGLTTKPTKCVWASASCTYLGHVVGRGQVQPVDSKVTAVRNFMRPVSKTDIRLFLGMTGYYRKFVDDCA